MDELWNTWVASTPERTRLFANFKSTDIVPEGFPVGMRVLAVDDDDTCLDVLELMLLRCNYRVEVCSNPTLALSTLRESKDGFDLVLTALHMSAMKGFTLLQRIKREMDIPVILMSADTRPSTILGGKKHGAVDCFFKPVHMVDLEDMWQYVIRRRCNEYVSSRRLEQSNHDAGNTSFIMDGSEHKKVSSSRKRRHMWTEPIHEQFVEAVNVIGIDKAVPKRILELMPGLNLTKEIIASHLQKYRLHLKKLGREILQQNELVSSSCSSIEQNAAHSRSGFLDLGTLGEALPQTVLSQYQHTATVEACSMVVQPTNNFQIGASSVPMNRTPMVVPSQSLFQFQASNNPVAVSQHVYNGSNDLDQGVNPSLSINVPYGMGQLSDSGLKNFAAGPGTSTDASLGPEQRRNFHSVGTDTSNFPWFAVDDVESPITDPDNAIVGSSVPEGICPSDFINNLPK